VEAALDDDEARQIVYARANDYAIHRLSCVKRETYFNGPNSTLRCPLGTKLYDQVFENAEFRVEFKVVELPTL
jgi:hypothetical protein